MSLKVSYNFKKSKKLVYPQQKIPMYLSQTVSHLCIKLFPNFWELSNFSSLLSKNRSNDSSTRRDIPFFTFYLFFPILRLSKRHVIPKRRNNNGIFMEFAKKMQSWRMCALSIARSTDYNRKLFASRDAFFLMIDSLCIALTRIANTKVMMARKKKNALGLSKLYTLRETRGKSTKRSRWIVSFVRRQC